MSESDQQAPVFSIQRVYLKDLSLEQPNAPSIFTVQDAPEIDIKLGLGAEHVVPGIMEITVTATITAKVQDKTLYLVEGKQAAIFEIRNIPEEHLDPIVGIQCPQIIYPYLRSNIADVIQRAGFPPLHLAEINFQSMYEQQRAQSASVTTQ
jgi:preprotein translocase subunit SecB